VCLRPAFRFYPDVQIHLLMSPSDSPMRDALLYSTRLFLPGKKNSTCSDPAPCLWCVSIAATKCVCHGPCFSKQEKYRTSSMKPKVGDWNSA